ncbi:MAG: type II toxin-antitoxin system RelE/ParE family toxin [Syntrophales bacterium]|nr:type II toxin-antitoxin system RelE/ParE family toxin [Syntrophales bacterium]MDD5641741.1 type II toxin-antitoxin system RelE/ParE family toxin [Syntrophales bacterium]
MRVFKNKWFARWARTENISDSALLQAATEVVAGQVEADLGGCLFKKRLAREGGGKRSGYRVVIGYKKPNSDRIIFLYAFAKNARANISDKEKEALSLVAEAFVSARDSQVSLLLKEGSIVEVQDHE